MSGFPKHYGYSEEDHAAMVRIHKLLSKTVDKEGKEIDFSGWLDYFADGILDELRRIRKSLPEQSTRKPRLEPHHQQVLDYIEEHGSITQREYGSISSRSLASRKLDFDKLVKLNLIEAKGVGRGTYYVKVLGALAV